MSVVGFDVGNESCVVAAARQRAVEVLLNDESKRETPSVVSFGDKQRFIGTAGAASALMNPKNTISQIKRLIGLRFDNPDLQRDLPLLPFRVSCGHDLQPLVHVRYLREDRTFTPTQLLGMLLSNLRDIARKNLPTAVSNCCIGVPAYFTDAQRRAVLDAAAIAGLRPLRLIHETTATALAYGIYKTDLPEKDPLNVVFVDVGHSSLQVCVAAFRKGELKVLSHAYDRNLGGRDFNEALFHHFAAKFQAEIGIDVRGNARASMRLRAACEKLKKVLSANPDAAINIECLLEEKDVRAFMRREEFVAICQPLLERVTAPLERAMRDAGIGLDGDYEVEVVGSGSRVPAVMRLLTEFFGKEPRRTMNASECVARGCALQCAILSPTFKVREFQVQESFPFSISLAWKSLTHELQDGSMETDQNKIVIAKGSSFPVTKSITFKKSSTFAIDALYADVGTQGDRTISRYMIGPFNSSNNDCATVKFRIQLNIHGVLAVDSATLIEEEEGTEEVQESLKVDTKMDSDGNAPNGVNDMDIPATSVQNGFVPAEELQNGSSAPTESVAKVAKRKLKKIKVPVTENVLYGKMSSEDLQKATKQEGEMELQDKAMEDTKEKKNAVESYVYDMRNKLRDQYHDFVDDGEREKIYENLQVVEDWLYDEGEDESRDVYIAKLEELKKEGDPIEKRYKESLERGVAVQHLLQRIHGFREAAMSNDPKYEHIDATEKQRVLHECADAENWLNQRREQQDALPKFATPILSSADLKNKMNTLHRLCMDILSRPKPMPPPEPHLEIPPAGANPPDGKAPLHDGEDNMECTAADTKETLGSCVGEPMETDKPEPLPERIAA